MGLLDFVVARVYAKSELFLDTQRQHEARSLSQCQHKKHSVHPDVPLSFCVSSPLIWNPIKPLWIRP